MHAQVHDRAAVTGIVEIMDHEVDVGYLDDPVGPHFEVIQIEASLFLIKSLPLRRQFLDGQQILPEFRFRAQVQLVPAVEGCDLQVRVFRSGRCRNERTGRLLERFIHISGPDIAQCFQEDDIQLGHVIRPFII